jgi:adenine-specific DNA-methyltransferase
VYKNAELGNIEVLNGEDKVDKYIYVESFPCETKVNSYYQGVRRNWLKEKYGNSTRQTGLSGGAAEYQAGDNVGKDCIYIYNLTRRRQRCVFWEGRILRRGLLMLNPKKKCDLNRLVVYLNSEGSGAILYFRKVQDRHRQL